MDLHTHSTASDGTFTPAELVSVAAAAKVEILALTDHDTVAGIESARAAVQQFDLTFIPGIEISAVHEGTGHHVLGLFVDPASPLLAEYSSQMVQRRLARAEETIRKLEELGFRIPASDVYERPGQIITRRHIASFLIESGQVESYAEVFDRYLGSGRPAFVEAGEVTVAAAIQLIRRAGGLSALAHPGDWTSEVEIRGFAAEGLDGIEVVHPSHDDRLEAYYRQLAARMGLLVTGGSDFHGIEQAERVRLGRWREPPEVFERIRAAAQERARDR